MSRRVGVQIGDSLEILKAARDTVPMREFLHPIEQWRSRIQPGGGLTRQSGCPEGSAFRSEIAWKSLRQLAILSLCESFCIRSSSGARGFSPAADFPASPDVPKGRRSDRR